MSVSLPFIHILFVQPLSSYVPACNVDNNYGISFYSLLTFNLGLNARLDPDLVYSKLSLNRTRIKPFLLTAKLPPLPVLVSVWN